MTDEQLSRLPRWAKDYIRHLENERDEAVQACDNQTPSPIFTDFIDGFMKPTGFVQGRSVYFRIEGEKNQYTFQVALNKKSIEIRCRQGVMVVLPGCTNVIEVCNTQGWKGNE